MSTVQRFAGRVAMVTGGGTGIGAATARRLADEGAHVVVTGRRPEVIDEVARSVDGIAVAGDVADADHARRAVAAAVDRWGRLDVLVANAGVGATGTAADDDRAAWRIVVDTDLHGTAESVRAALAPMVEAGRGAVVVVSSVAALVAGPASAAYASAKAAVVALARSVAFDFGPAGIRANAICPGWVDTPMARGEMAPLGGVDVGYREVSRHLPLRRVARPEEIAAAIAFLASDDASFVTGATLVADGGGAAVDVGTLAFAGEVSVGGGDG